jgi:hypothetical protein
MATLWHLPLPNKYVTPYIRPDKRESMTMTIAVGFRCVDGVVLCADTQMTDKSSGFKFEDDKIHTISHYGGENRWTVAIAYSGDPNILKSLYEKVSRALIPKADAVTLEDVRDAIQQALLDVHNTSANMDTEYIDVICGVSIGGNHPDTAMYVGRRTTLYEEQSMAFAGVGDSALSRFLTDTLPIKGRNHTAEKALLLGVYIVDQAKRFIDGCGGDTHTLIIRDQGESSLLTKRPFFASDKPEKLVRSINSCIHTLLEILLCSEVETSYFHGMVEKTKKEISQFYGVSPT